MNLSFSKTIHVVIMTIAMLLIPANVGAQGNFYQQFDPTGLWEADAGDSRFDVTLCGDGTQICAKLVWIKPSEVNTRNINYLDKYVIFEGKRATPSEWRGQIDIYGTRVGGSVKIAGQDKIQVVGCAFLVLCQGFGLNRVI